MNIRGIIAPILTPMYEDESLNFEELSVQINRQIKAKVAAIFCLGTNGEFYNLSESEKKQVIIETVKVVNHRVPVFAGTGCAGTKETIALSQFAKDAGADVVSVICPYFAAASQDEIYMHYKTVAKAVDIPIIIYNIPARTGNNIFPDTIARLASIKNIVGAKDSSGNFDNILQYIEKTKEEDFVVYSGNDSLILWTLHAGGVGGIAGCANVYPETMVSICDKFFAGDFDGARVAQDSIRPLRNVFKYGNPNTVIKMATQLLGYAVGPCRAPFNTLSTDGLKVLNNTIMKDKERRLR